jgi:hypothetical protein
LMNQISCRFFCRPGRKPSGHRPGGTRTRGRDMRLGRGRWGSKPKAPLDRCFSSGQ